MVHQVGHYERVTIGIGDFDTVSYNLLSWLHGWTIAWNILNLNIWLKSLMYRELTILIL